MKPIEQWFASVKDPEIRHYLMKGMGSGRMEPSGTVAHLYEAILLCVDWVKFPMAKEYYHMALRGEIELLDSQE